MVVKLRLTRQRITLGVVGLLLVGVGGAAYATVPDSGGTINGCYDTKTGVLRIVDAEAGQTCENKESSLVWPSATTKAYARITAAGTVNAALSKGITDANVSHPATGIYCLRNLGFQPRVVVGNGAAAIQLDASAPNGFVAVGYDTIVTAQTLILPTPDTVLGFCDTETGPSQASVRIYVAQAGTGLVDRPFSIMVDD